jgi:tetratricopeptide (TPR) repeat protein
MWKALGVIVTLIGIIGTLVLALMGYALFKDKREYENAVKGAEKACEKAEQWEEKARNTFEKIDSLFHEIEIKSDKQARSNAEKLNVLVKAKLDDIEAKAQKSTQQMDAKALEQIHIAELLSNAFRLNSEGKYDEACDKYAEIIKFRPEDFSVYNYWGISLCNLAKIKNDKKLFEQAYQKYEQAIKIKPDMYEAYNNWGNALGNWAKLKGDEKLFEQACQKYEQAIKIKPDMYEAYNNWGIALCGLAGLKNDENPLVQACDKLERSFKIKPNEYLLYVIWGGVLGLRAKFKRDETLFNQAVHKLEEAIRINQIRPEAYDCWASILLYLAQIKIGTPEYEGLLKQAEEKALKAESLKIGFAAYNLACVYARRGKKEECRKWLLVGQEAGTLPRKDHATKDSDLDSVKNEPWFKEIKWKGEK